MTIKEFRELTANCKDEDIISFEIADGCCGDSLNLSVCYTDVTDSNGFRFLRIQFEALPGYKSCIQSGGTKRDDEEYWSKYSF